MKYKIFLLLFFVSLFFFSSFEAKTVLASNKTELEKLIQQIEILKQEVLLLQILNSNFQLRQEIDSPSYLAVNLSDNSILLEKNPDRVYSMASVTKLMTAIIVLENIDPNQKITLTEEMLKPLGCSPVLFPGLSINAENLLKASLIQSVNDAAESLVYFLGEKNFLALMNQKTKELGMKDTVFFDAHGLDPNNHSTAEDLIKLLSYIYNKHPEILIITKDNNFWLPDPKGNLLKFRNINNFYPLANFIGGKTGYLVEAKQTLASIFKINEKPIAIVILYSKNRQADTFAIIRKIEK